MHLALSIPAGFGGAIGFLKQAFYFSAERSLPFMCVACWRSATRTQLLARQEFLF